MWRVSTSRWRSLWGSRTEAATPSPSQVSALLQQRKYALRIAVDDVERLLLAEEVEAVEDRQHIIRRPPGLRIERRRAGARDLGSEDHARRAALADRGPEEPGIVGAGVEEQVLAEIGMLVLFGRAV